MKVPILTDEKAEITWKKRIYSIPGMKIWEQPALIIAPLQHRTGFIPGQSSPLDTFNPEFRKVFTFPQSCRPGEWKHIDRQLENTSQRSGQEKNCWIYAWMLR